MKKLTMKEKKGVSPLVATVLLVALVVIMAIFIWLWYSDFIRNQQDKQEIELELSCVQDVGFQLSEFSCEESSQINFKAENTGSIDILSFKVNYEGSNGGGSIDVGVGVVQGLSSLIGITTAESQNGYVDLEIIPIIGSFENSKICDSKYQAATLMC